MNPQNQSDQSPQQSYATQPPTSGQYDFINNGSKAPKRPINVMSGLGFRRKLLIIGAGALILIIIITLVSNLFIKGADATNQQMKELAQQQQEIIRIAEIGTKKARGQSASNLAFTTKATLESDQKATVSYVTTQGIKLPLKELVMKKNSKTDQALTAAEQSNQFDDVFIETMRKQLRTYQTDTKKAYNETTGKKAKAVLTDNYNHVNILLDIK